MADRYLLESGAPDGYQIEDGSGVLLLEGVDPPPAGLPFVEPRSQTKQRGYLDPIPNVLIATLTLVAVVRGPVFMGDGYHKPPLHEVAPPANTLPLNVVPQAPFLNIQVEGVRYRTRSDVQPGVSLQQSTLATDALSPLRSQPDWNGSRFRLRNDEAPQQNLFGNTLAPAAPTPFALYDWPTSRKSTGKYLLETQSLQATTLATDGLSTLRYQPDWNGTRFRQRNDLAPQQDLQTSTLATSALSTLRAQPDWTGTRFRLHDSELKQSNLMLSTLAPQAALPFANTDWTGYRRPLRGEASAPGQLLPLFAPSSGKPFLNFDWNGKRKSTYGTIFYAARVIGTFAGNPFVHRDSFSDGAKQRPRGTIFYPARLSPTTVPEFLETRPVVTKDTFSYRKPFPKREEHPIPNLHGSTLSVLGLTPEQWPEPSRRKTPGCIEQDTNRFPLGLAPAPNLKPPPLSIWPEAKLRPRAFSTEVDQVQPIPLVRADTPFIAARFPEGKALRRLDPLQPSYPLTMLFQQLDGPFPYWVWEWGNKILAVGLEPQPTNILLLGVDQGKPPLTYTAMEVRRPRGRMVELDQQGSEMVLLVTEPKPFSIEPWPEGFWKKGGRLGRVADQAARNLTILLPIGAEPPIPPDPPTGTTPRVEAMEEYHVSNILVDPAAMRELQRVEQVLQQFDTKGIRVTHIVPVKPVDGELHICDGVNWNPLGDGVKRPVWFDSATQTWKAMVPVNALTAGSYVPVMFSELNIASVSAHSSWYMRVGNVVHVTVHCVVDVTATGPASFGVSLPIGSNVTSTTVVGGVGTGLEGHECMFIQGDVTNDRAQVHFEAVELSIQTVKLLFTYLVLPA